MVARINQRQAVRAIADRMTFQAGALNASRIHRVNPYSEGMMRGEAYEQWRVDCLADRITYVVRSYYTPIAWFTTDRGWIVPADKYSVTTSRHQGIVRRAVAEDQAYQQRLAEDFARARVILDQIAAVR